MADAIKIVLGDEAAELLGLYNGKIAALVAILHQEGVLDGRAFAGEPTLFCTELGKSVARALSSAMTRAVDEVEGKATRGSLRLVAVEEGEVG